MNNQIGRNNLPHSTPSGKGLGGQYHDASEHMLRRKTPNGTLAAGYDGTPVQWSSRIPALKHVVLPSSGDVVPESSAFGGAISYRERNDQSQSGWKHPGGQFGGQRKILDPPSHLSTPGMSSWTQVSSPSGGSNPVLNHIPIHQSAPFYPYNNMQIPTVIQPAYQPASGPVLSATNEAGLYGPYWPNGKFVPYRPAAVRGSGYHHMDYGTGMDYQVFPEQVRLHRETLQTTHQLNQAPDFIQRNHTLYPSPSFKAPQLLGNAYTNQRQSQLFLDTNIGNGQISDGSRTPTMHIPNRTSNVEFKEKTLSWAHSIYVDLLAFLHKTNKENKTAKPPHGVHSHSKSSIYPKPPRQSVASLGYSQWTPSTSSGNGIRYWQGNSGPNEGRHPKLSPQDIPHYLSGFQHSHASSVTPIKRAHEALDMLTSLCEQSNWSWIDGMLLGGCLAYGLEEYGKALDWYSKIINLDPRFEIPNYSLMLRTDAFFQARRGYVKSRSHTALSEQTRGGRAALVASS